MWYTDDGTETEPQETVSYTGFAATASATT
jgi:hypothetical protein